MQPRVEIFYLSLFFDHEYLFRRLDAHAREFGNGIEPIGDPSPQGWGAVRTGLDTPRNACGASVFWIEQGARAVSIL